MPPGRMLGWKWSPGAKRKVWMVGVALLSTFPLLISCDFMPEHLRRGIQEQRLENLGMESVDPSGSAAKAGMSFLPNLDLPPMDTKRIGSDTTSQGFKRYVHRCGTCHSAPDPGLRTASAWGSVFPTMENHMVDGGLIPLGPTDRVLILGFLGRHAKEGR